MARFTFPRGVSSFQKYAPTEVTSSARTAKQELGSHEKYHISLWWGGYVVLHGVFKLMLCTAFPHTKVII